MLSRCRFALLCLLACTPVAVAEAERPNVVIILTDDQGWGDLSVHGNRQLETPNVDSLARDGAAFDRFYVCPVCSPTRAEFLTGRYHPRGGVFSTSTGGERLDLDEVAIGTVFRDAGYATGAFGKWHNGMQYPYHPRGRGFDEFYGFCSGHWGNYFSPVLEHNGERVWGIGYINDDMTSHAIRFIDTHKEEPFFCYVPYNTPHSPMQVPDRWFDKFADMELTQRGTLPQREDVKHTRAALAMCENINWNVGRILKKLDDDGLAENTIVIYFCDNGPNGHRYNGGMKGTKGSTDEGGVRSPCFVRWPAKIKGGTKVEPIAGAIDLLPTLCEATGVPPPEGREVDGVSVLSLLTGEAKDWPDRLIFSHWNDRVSVRSQRYRLDHTGKLFDMAEDPNQTKDVAGEQPQVTERLTKAVAEWKRDVLVELTKEPRPFPVGHSEFPVTQLPARDAVPHGKVRRSAGAPNCSYMTNWVGTEDRITWDVEVHEPGTYEAVVYYACPEADVGSTVELRLGDNAVTAKVTEANDPPARGMERDRTDDRGSESYVKDWKSLRLGEIQLDKGRGTLTLKATEVPGSQVMEMRSLWLTLKTEE